MTQISHHAPHPGSVLPQEARPQVAAALASGDVIVFEGSSLEVLASGRLTLATGALEVAHVRQAETAAPGGAQQRVELNGPASLIRKLAVHLGAIEGVPYQLKRGDVSLIDQVCTDYALLVEGADFSASPVPRGS